MSASSHIGLRPDTGPADLFARIEAEGRGEIVTIPLYWRSFNKAVGFGLKMGCVSMIAGAPGAGKSYLALNICLHAEKNGFSWRYLPLEDEADDWIQRAMAAHFGDWRMVGNPEDDTEEARMLLAEHKRTRLASERDLLGKLYDRICRNPQLVGSLEDIESAVDYDGVLQWVYDESEKSDLIVVDPVGFIDFSNDGKDWVGQQKFMKRLTAIAKKTNCHVMLMAHIGKRPGRVGLSTMDDLQGSAMFSRSAHYVFILDRHDEQEADVFSSWNTNVSHKLTMTVGKSRGGFSGTKIAMDLDSNGPVFKEHGIIKPKKRKG